MTEDTPTLVHREFRSWLDQEARRYERQLKEFVFCPTGKGGGVDNSCSPADSHVPTKERKYLPAPGRLRAAVKFPNGEIAIAHENDFTHNDIFDRLWKEKHRNLVSPRDPEVEPGWANSKGLFFDREMVLKATGENDTWGRPEIKMLVGKPGRYAQLREFVFCPTGEGGGIDPTCSPGGQEPQVREAKGRVFKGDPIPVRNALSKPDTGKLGEELALQVVSGSRRMNGKWNNFPIDLVKGGTVYEVKAGLVSNGRDAQKWRLTIGEPGPKEKSWLAKASSAAKERWNDRKARLIVERKKRVMAELEKKLGRKVSAKTLTFIVNPDTRTADVFEFDGFHPVIRWNHEQAKSGYKKTVKYERGN